MLDEAEVHARFRDAYEALPSGARDAVDAWLLAVRAAQRADERDARELGYIDLGGEG